jgi:hypothetical protein
MFGIKSILRFIVFTNIFISFCGAVLSIGICHQLKIPDGINYGFIFFFATLSVYNFQRIIRSYHLKSVSSFYLSWIRKYALLLWVIILVSCFFTLWLGVSFFHLITPLFYLITVGVGLSVFYVIRVSGINLRSIPTLKIHLISLTWVISVGFVPIINECGSRIELFPFLFVSSHYFFFMALCILFDIRDLEIDDPKIRTVPQILGKHKSKMLVLVFLSIFALSIMSIHSSSFYFALFFLLLISFMLIFILKSSHPNLTDRFYIVIDSCILLLGLIYFFFY